jgi:sugar phosphate isomerase/epimerase
MTLEGALRMMGDLEFSKADIAIQTNGVHLTPAVVAADVALASRSLRVSHGVTPGAFYVEIDESGYDAFLAQFHAVCKLANHSGVATLTLPAAPAGASVDTEVHRLRELLGIASSQGLVFTVKTKIGTLTETPDAAVALCEKVPGLGLTLDPSHYICGPHQGRSYDHVFPFVRHVHLRDTGRTPDKMQVKIGQGELEYGRLITQLSRHAYDRLLTVEIVDAPELPFCIESEVRTLKYLVESLI